MSTKSIHSDTLNMLRSLYDFKPTHKKTLGFNENDYFILYQTINNHKKWWEVMNERGETGYVPSNYLEKVIVSPAFYLQFLDNCLDYVRRNDLSTKFDINEQNELLEKLNKMKKNIEQIPEVVSHSIGGDDGPVLLFKNSEGQLEAIKSSVSKSNSNLNSSCSDCKTNNSFETSIEPSQEAQSKEKVNQTTESLHEVHEKEEPQKQKSETLPQSLPRLSSTDYKDISAITHQSVHDLIKNVSINTQLSPEMSRIALVTTLQALQQLLPPAVTPYLKTIFSYSQELLKTEEPQIELPHDACRLKIIFNELTSYTEDSQECWMLHEDESVVKEYLKELILILTNADVSISKHILSSQQYHVITTLIEYYQMEARWSIRQLLLQAFGVLCSFEKTIISIILNSVLPEELAKDIMANARNVAKLNYSSLLLTMVMSMGESIPMPHYEYLGVPFISFILDNIECPPDTDTDNQIPELFTNLIISYNLQFTSYNNNIILKALSERSMIKTFTERLLFLLNEEEDPVRIFDHKPRPPHSLLKLLLDMFSNRLTANLFYIKEILALIDIIVRLISNLPTGDHRRLQCLELYRRIMRNTYYEEHLHRRDEILKCFTRIFCEESGKSKNDQKLVREIMNEFPQYFK